MLEAAGYAVRSVRVNTERRSRVSRTLRALVCDAAIQSSRDWPLDELGKIGAAIVLHKPKSVT